MLGCSRSSGGCAMLDLNGRNDSFGETIDEGHGVLVDRIGRGDREISSDVGEVFGIPTDEGVAFMLGCSGSSGSCAILDLNGRNDSSGETIDEGHGVLVDSLSEYRGIGGVCIGGNDLGIPTGEGVGVLSVAFLGGGAVGILGHLACVNGGGDVLLAFYLPGDGEGGGSIFLIGAGEHFLDPGIGFNILIVRFAEDSGEGVLGSGNITFGKVEHYGHNGRACGNYHVFRTVTSDEAGLGIVYNGGSNRRRAAYKGEGFAIIGVDKVDARQSRIDCGNDGDLDGITNPCYNDLNITFGRSLFRIGDGHIGTDPVVILYVFIVSFGEVYAKGIFGPGVIGVGSVENYLYEGFACGNNDIFGSVTGDEAGSGVVNNRAGNRSRAACERESCSVIGIGQVDAGNSQICFRSNDDLDGVADLCRSDSNVDCRISINGGGAKGSDYHQYGQQQS